MALPGFHALIGSDTTERISGVGEEISPLKIIAVDNVVICKCPETTITLSYKWL